MNWTLSIAILLLALASGFPSLAQDAVPVIPDDAQLPMEDFDQGDELSSTNELGQTNELGGTNGLSEKADPNQTNGSGRRRRGPYRRGSFQTNVLGQEFSSNSTNGGAGSANNAASDRGPARPGYETFKIVTQRNIFDPNRTPNNPNYRRFAPGPAPAVTQSFSLVGTMSYEKGSFAFFDGTSSEFRKVVMPAERIASYTITHITPNSVELSSGTNRVELRVGMQMHSIDQGPWLPSGSSQSLAVAPGSAPAVSPTSGSGGTSSEAATGEESEILKRLRQRREQE